MSILNGLIERYKFKYKVEIQVEDTIWFYNYETYSMYKTNDKIYNS